MDVASKNQSTRAPLQCAARCNTLRHSFFTQHALVSMAYASYVRCYPRPNYGQNSTPKPASQIISECACTCTCGAGPTDFLWKGVSNVLDSDVMTRTEPATRLDCPTWADCVIKVSAATLVVREWLSGPSGVTLLGTLRWKDPVCKMLESLTTRWLDIAVANPGGSRSVVIDWARHALRSIEALECLQANIFASASQPTSLLKTKLRTVVRNAIDALDIAWTDERLVKAIAHQSAVLATADAAASAFESAPISEARLQALLAAQRHEDAINFTMSRGWGKQFIALCLEHHSSDAFASKPYLDRLKQNADALLFSASMLPTSDLVDLITTGAKVGAPVRWRCVVVVALACAQPNGDIFTSGNPQSAIRIADLLKQLTATSSLKLSARWKEFVDVASTPASSRGTHTTRLVSGVQSAEPFDFAALVFNVLLTTNFSVDLFYKELVNAKLDDAAVAFAVPALLALWVMPPPPPPLFYHARLCCRRCSFALPLSALAFTVPLCSSLLFSHCVWHPLDGLILLVCVDLFFCFALPSSVLELLRAKLLLTMLAHTHFLSRSATSPGKRPRFCRYPMLWLCRASLRVSSIQRPYVVPCAWAGNRWTLCFCVCAW
jgi:hypothetical protein